MMSHQALSRLESAVPGTSNDITKAPRSSRHKTFAGSKSKHPKNVHYRAMPASVLRKYTGLHDHVFNYDLDMASRANRSPLFCFALSGQRPKPLDTKDLPALWPGDLSGQFNGYVKDALRGSLER